MKIPDITNTKPLHQLDGSDAGKAGTSKKAAPASGRESDVIELSAAVGGQATAQLEQAQAQRVASIKSRVLSGTYQVSALSVAGKMLAADSGI